MLQIILSILLVVCVLISPVEGAHAISYSS